LYWHTNNLVQAKELFTGPGMEPGYAPFYAVRANLWSENEESERRKDLERAIGLDKEGWRYQKLYAENEIRLGKYEQALSIAEPYYAKHPADYIMGMLYARTLLLNKKYKESDALLSRLNIIPFEGATDGRELYREAKLMQAVQEMEKKNFKTALQFINASKVWPANLGVGKPYDEDIDLRLEEWMNYLCFTKLGNAASAQSSLNRVLQTKRSFPSANDLVSAWAMDRLNRNTGMQWLEERIQQFPESKILTWCKSVLQKQSTNIIQAGESNATIRILEQLNQFY
jgi:tetratricopeptide (TPR) repeat protein